MELLIKLSADKPLRIGIKYTYGYQVRKPYEELMCKHKSETFMMLMEPIKHTLNLTLQSEQSGTKILYKDLEYKPEQLKRMMHAGKPPFQFVHIYSDANALLIAKPFNKEEFITITCFELIGSENYR